MIFKGILLGLLVGILQTLYDIKEQLKKGE